jgi:hypothetical protein
VPREKFIDKTFRKSSVRIIEQANSIIAEYQRMGFSLTLRQLYYQFVARALIENKQTEYKRLGEIINDARLAGLIDWNAIEDRTRNVRVVNMWDQPEDVIQASAEQYRENPWDNQRYRPEVWIEKDALVGVIEPICNRMRVPFFACRGYTSQSEQWRAGRRFAGTIREGKRPLILHLGDHDPSGLDMARDNSDRLAMFARQGVMVNRLALNMDQVEEYNPPPNPAKESDSRFSGYRDEHGDESWELDALDPPVIEALIQAALDDVIDYGQWQEDMQREEDRRDVLQAIANRWDDVTAFIQNGDE